MRVFRNKTVCLGIGNDLVKFGYEFNCFILIKSRQWMPNWRFSAKFGSIVFYPGEWGWGETCRNLAIVICWHLQRWNLHSRELCRLLFQGDWGIESEIMKLKPRI